MKLKLSLERHEISKLCFLLAFFFKFINGEIHYYDGSMLQKFYGFPFIYYGNPGPISMDDDVYITPMLINISIYMIISFLIIKSISYIFTAFGMKQYENDKFFYFFAILFFIPSLIYLIIMTHNVILCCGPRGEIEIADQFKFWY